MKLEFDPGLIEEVVFKAMKLKEESGDSAFLDEYHTFADPIYENHTPDERPAKFRKIEWDFFRKMGFYKAIEEIFLEFSEIDGLVAGGVVAKARSQFDEGSNLVKGPDLEPGKKRVVIKLLAERFHDNVFLKKLIRHELMHVVDMLTASFGYKDERLGLNPMEESIIKERYSTIWDIYVDSRLISQGKETVVDKEGRYLEFAALYHGFPSDVNEAIFNALWEDRTLTHDRILALAENVNKVMAIADDLVIGKAERKKRTLLPGAQCPLCEFRTYNWVENIEQEPHLVKAVQEEFPNWMPDDGICERCLEVYRCNA